MKKRQRTIQEVGFEYLPEGEILSQFVDFNHAMGVAYERCIGYTKDFHTHNRLNLTFPRSSSRIQFTTKNPSQVFVVDDAHFLWMPKDVIHRQDTASVIYDNLAIFPDAAIVKKALANFFKRHGKQVTLPRITEMRSRTPLLDALLSAYFAERILEKKPAAALDGLTYQIFEELLRILFCPRKTNLLIQDTSSDGVTLRAIKYIEANLFAKMDSKTIAKMAHASIPTLFRKFKSATGMSPHEYIVKRRLDEAMTLLKHGDHTVSDVSILIGYEDIAAFSKAFTSHFKKNPSSFRSTYPR